MKATVVISQGLLQSCVEGLSWKLQRSVNSGWDTLLACMLCGKMSLRLVFSWSSDRTVLELYLAIGISTPYAIYFK